MRRITLIFLMVLFVSTVLVLGEVTSPEQFLGYKVGADGHLASYDQIHAYFKKLAQESPKLKIVELGKSTLGNPLFMAVITDSNNMLNLDRYIAQSRMLRDARGLTPAQAREIARNGKVIVMATCNIHSTEIGASQMAMELAYDLVTGKTIFPVNDYLKDVIFLLLPSINPDGQKMVVEWYNKYKGTKYEGGRMPWLYHHYAGHDDNRDWFMFNLSETRLVSKALYKDWMPQVHIDEHQMGSSGPRLFLPPFENPPEPNVPALVWRQVGMFGMDMASDLEQMGLKGVVHAGMFTGWWIGACDDTSWFHNVVGLLSEMASVRIATPVYVEPDEVSRYAREKSIFSPSPWKGGWWRLRDIVDYEIALNLSLIKTAHLHKEDILYDFYKASKDAIENRPDGCPFAYLIPPDQWDRPTALKMINILNLGGVEIHQATKAFKEGNSIYPAGTFVLYTAQPYRAYLVALMQKQIYPDLRRNANEPPVPPYDNAAWTLPYQMGVYWKKIDTPFQAETKLVKTFKFPQKAAMLPKKGYLVFSSHCNDSFTIAEAALKKGFPLYRSAEAADGLEKGDFVLDATNGRVTGILSKAESKGLMWKALQKLPDKGLVKIKLPRIAIYQSWTASMDEGWTRLVLDRFGFDYKVLHNKDIKEGKLGEKFDVLILPDLSEEIIIKGKPTKGPYARYFTALPPEYEGGIGNKGVKAIRAFVNSGGCLVCLNRSSDFAIKTFKLPARNVLKGVGRDKFLCPTSLLNVTMTDRSPLTWGMQKKAVAMFSRGMAFQTWIPSGHIDRKVAVLFPERNILASGWLTGGRYIALKAAVIDFNVEKGHVFTFGIRPQFRAQPHGTFKLFFNALFYPY